jgi:biopolymer transport protein ExbD
MADIAFLLLIFFLVTTTIETDSGINRKLPPMEELEDPPIIKEKIFSRLWSIRIISYWLRRN